MKRWLALIASITMQCCMGVVYAWSTFIPALKQEYGIHEGHAGLIFGVCIASFTVTMVFGGILQNRYGSRRIGSAGGILFLAGYWTGSASGGNVPLLLIGFGAVAGAGIGLGYVCPLATGIRWFPKHKGLITGLAVAGFGLGGVFFSKIGQQMLNADLPVLELLRNIGGIVGITVVISSQFLFVPKTAPADCATTEPCSLRAVLGSRSFRVLFWQMFCGTFGGLLIIGNLKPIGMLEGMSDEASTRAVMLFALGNASGRILWGLWYDRFSGRVITACMMLLAAGAVIMGLRIGPWGFYTSTAVTAFAFGGCFVLFAARVADEFGNHRISEIYPFIFLGYGIAGLTGPSAGGWMLAHTGATRIPCLAVILLALGGTLSSVCSNRALKKSSRPQAG